MIKKIVFLLLLSICGVGIIPADSQNLIFVFSGGGQQSFPLSDIRSITYNADTMNLNKSDGTIIPLVIDTISNFSYATFTGVLLETCKTSNDLIIYPNPSKDYFSIEYEVQKSNIVTIELFKNSNGELLKQSKEFKIPGKYKIGWNLPQGIYNLKIQNEGKTVAKKIIILN